MKSFTATKRSRSSGSFSFLANLNNRFEFVWFSIQINIKKLFLPKGYPRTVSPDYLEYQIWDTIQALASSVTGALAAQAVLVGVGVGNAHATVLGASLAWMLKDGAGMIGKIAFVGWQGSYLDCDCKKWRLIADIVNDCALFLELCSPFFPNMFTAIVCVANIFKSVVSVSGGATRAAIVLHQAINNNVADVSAKDNSQETLSNLIALLFNLCAVYFVTGNWGLIWCGFFVLTALHLYANYRAVRCLKFTTFNRSRFSIAVQRWLQESFHDGNLNVSQRHFPSVHWVNEQEPILLSAATPCVHLTADQETVISGMEDVLSDWEYAFRDVNYILYCDDWDSLFRRTNHSTPVFQVILKTGSTSHDQLLSMLHVEFLMFLREVCLSATLSKEMISIIKADSLESFSRNSLSVVRNVYDEMVRSISRATEPRWRLDSVHFNVEDEHSGSDSVF